MLPATPTYPVRVRLPILWGDMDSLGHVNNLVYLRWFEEARIQYFVKMALANGSAPTVILAHQRCDYLSPLRWPGEIEARISVVKIGNSSFTMAFSIVSDDGGREVARGEGVMVAFDYATNRSVPLPDAVKHDIAAFESAGPT